jgi:hypothetical protein
MEGPGTAAWIAGSSPLLSGLARGDRLNGRRFLRAEAQYGGLRQKFLPGHIRLLVGAGITPAHDGNLLNSKQKRHARA